MRSMKKRLALMLSLIMVLCACMIGCSGGGKKDTVSGKYVAEFNALEMMNSSMGDAGLELKTDIIAEFELELKEDKTFTFDLNAEAFRDSIIAGISADADGIIKELFASLGVSTDDLEDLAKQAGYDSYDAFKQELIDAMGEQFDDAAIEQMRTDSHSEGTYEVKDKQITLTGEDSGGVDEMTINDDGSLTTSIDFEDSKIELTFVKQ